MRRVGDGHPHARHGVGDLGVGRHLRVAQTHPSGLPMAEGCLRAGAHDESGLQRAPSEVDPVPVQRDRRVKSTELPPCRQPDEHAGGRTPEHRARVELVLVDVAGFDAGHAGPVGRDGFAQGAHLVGMVAQPRMQQLRHQDVRAGMPSMGSRRAGRLSRRRVQVRSSCSSHSHCGVRQYAMVIEVEARCRRAGRHRPGRCQASRMPSYTAVEATGRVVVGGSIERDQTSGRARPASAARCAATITRAVVGDEHAEHGIGAVRSGRWIVGRCAQAHGSRSSRECSSG